MSESFSPSYSVNKKHKMEADIMNEEQISQTLLDQMVSSDRGQMIKAAIPYLPPKGQQIFSVYEKAVEFINTVSVFSPSNRTSKRQVRISAACSSEVSVLWEKADSSCLQWRRYASPG